MYKEKRPIVIEWKEFLPLYHAFSGTYSSKVDYFTPALSRATPVTLLNMAMAFKVMPPLEFATVLIVVSMVKVRPEFTGIAMRRMVVLILVRLSNSLYINTEFAGVQLKTNLYGG